MGDQGTCTTCGYNLPFHGRGCVQAAPTQALCPAHRTPAAPLAGSDDAKLRCTHPGCDAHGYHVRLVMS